MSTLFDDVSRIIASRISRRKALTLVSRAAGGAVLAALGLGKTSWGLAPPPYDEKGEKGKECKPGQTVCGEASHQICCDGKCCDPRQTCCKKKCCSGECCNGKCCESDEFCCNGKCADKKESKSGKCPPEDDD